jgi:protein translocase SecG subunit
VIGSAVLSLVQDILLYLIGPAGLLLILLILVQGGSGDMSSTFGGSQLDGTLGVGANKKLARLTGWMAFAFIVAVLMLAIPNRGDSAILRNIASEASATAAATQPAERAPAPAPEPTQTAPAATAAAAPTTAPSVPPTLVEQIQAHGATAAAQVQTVATDAAAAASAAVPGGLPFQLGQ